jgi:hypothetical protein
MATEPVHRNEMDDRTVRRWSPEERRQLRRDVHEAGRDVYGSPASSRLKLPEPTAASPEGGRMRPI